MGLNVGILGGLKGAGEAVSAISQETRKSLAEQLKMKALEEMNTRMAGVEHGYAMERQGAQLEAEKGMNEDRIRSSEKIAEMERGIKQKMINADKDSADARRLQAQAKAAADAMNIINKGGTTEEANAVLQAAELPLLEEYIIEPGSEGGPFGIGKKEPVIGRRMAGSRGILAGEQQWQTGKKPDQIIAGAQNTGNLKSDLDRLLKEGSQAMGIPQANADTISFEQNESPKPKGILSGAQSVPISKPELGDPSTWDVRQQAGKYFIITKDGPREMTAEQIQQWKAAQKGM